MKSKVSRYHGYLLPAQVISHGVWLYHQFCLSFRDVEELLAERGVIVSHETVRQWCQKFGLDYARNLRHRRGRKGDIWHLDELFVHIQGKRRYLWRAVAQDGDVIDIIVQRHRNARAAKRFFRKLLKGQGREPWRPVTDKLRSHPVAHRSVMPSVAQTRDGEVAHQPTRERERLMRRFKSVGQAQRFLWVHGVVQNLFRLGQHHLRSANYRLLRDRSFQRWLEATGV